MPSKNDLSIFKNKSATTKPILPNKEPKTVPDAPGAEQAQPAIRTGKVGRPKKAPKEKRNFRVMLSLTQGEGAKLDEKAGLADRATYIYDVLKRAGVFE